MKKLTREEYTFLSNAVTEMGILKGTRVANDQEKTTEQRSVERMELASMMNSIRLKLITYKRKR